jgi:hydrogenase maturation protease
LTTLIYAIGNPFRRDDGVARRVATLLPPGDYRLETPRELLPEMAEDVAAAARVFFVDADFLPGEVRLEGLKATCCPGLLGHGLRPCDLLSLTRKLYGFQGEAWLCRIPGNDFGQGEGLSPLAESNAHRAAELLAPLLAAPPTATPSSSH